jgi:hypothetical protein
MRRLAAITIGGLTACSLTTDFSGLSSGSVVSPDAASSSSSSTGGPSVDGSAPDGPKGDAGPASSVVIAQNASAFAAGGPQQHHVHFASNLGAYVVFYLSANDKNSLHTRITPDFVTFTDGPSLALPHPHDNEGRNFDVAYANIGGADIFHLAISIHDGPRFSFRARGRATKGGALTFDAASELDHDSSTFDHLDPDGPTVAILSSGRVIISSGYNGVQGHTANAVLWVANQLEKGAVEWDHTFAAGLELETASQSVNARSLLAFPGGALLTWERGDQEPRPTNLGYALYDGASWSPVNKVSFTQTPFDMADWDQVTTSDGRMHVVRFANGSYEHRYFDPVIHDGSALPALDHSVGDGIVMLANGAAPSAFVLTKSDRALKRSTLDGAAWSAWSDVGAADPQRSHLSGNGDVVLWQRGNDLVGHRLGP